MKRKPVFNLSVIASSLGLVLVLAGCKTTPELVMVDSSADVLRLGDDVRGHVFYQDASGAWVKSRNKITLPAGWFAGHLEP